MRSKRKGPEGSSAVFPLDPACVGNVRTMEEGNGLVQLALGELSSALTNAVGASGPIAHKLLKGEFRERRVISGLRPFIPQRYEMRSGIVVNSNGAFSAQQDIILSDAMQSSPFLAAGELGVYPVETVNAVIEVKSVATKKTIRDAVANVASVKQLLPDEPREHISVRAGRLQVGPDHDKPFGGVLFLESKIGNEAILDTYLEIITSVAPNNRPNALVVVGGVVLTWGAFDGEPSQPTTQPEPLKGTHILSQRLGKNSLLVFYMVLMKILESYDPPPLDLYSYILKSGGYGDFTLLTREAPGLPGES